MKDAKILFDLLFYKCIDIFIVFLNNRSLPLSMDIRISSLSTSCLFRDALLSFDRLGPTVSSLILVLDSFSKNGFLSFAMFSNSSFLNFTLPAEGFSLSEFPDIFCDSISFLEFKSQK